MSEGNTGHTTQEELEFDIDTLPIRKTRELENYVKQRLAMIQKMKSKKKNNSSSVRMSKQPSYMVIKKQ